jgi:hypothetical protein
MKALGIVILSSLGIGLLGILFKMLLIPVSNHLMLIGFMSLAGALFFQFPLSIALIEDKTLKIPGALMSLGLSITAIGVLYRYLYWMGWWPNIIVGGTMVMVVSLIFLILYRRFDIQRYGRYIRRNILIPWVAITFFALLGILLPKKTFYNTFSSRRATMTYEEFQLFLEQNNAHHPRK